MCTIYGIGSHGHHEVSILTKTRRHSERQTTWTYPAPPRDTVGTGSTPRSSAKLETETLARLLRGTSEGAEEEIVALHHWNEIAAEPKAEPVGELELASPRLAR